MFLDSKRNDECLIVCRYVLFYKDFFILETTFWSGRRIALIFTYYDTPKHR